MMRMCALALAMLCLSLSVRGAPIIGSLSDGQGNGYSFTGVNSGNNSTIDFSAHSPFRSSSLSLVVYTDSTDSTKLYINPTYTANKDAVAGQVGISPVVQSGAPTFPAGVSYTSTLSAAKGVDGSVVADYGTIHMTLTGITLIDSSGMSVSDFTTFFGQNQRQWSNVFHAQMQKPLPGVFHTYDASIVLTPEPAGLLVIGGLFLFLTHRRK